MEREMQRAVLMNKGSPSGSLTLRAPGGTGHFLSAYPRFSHETRKKPRFSHRPEKDSHTSNPTQSCSCKKPVGCCCPI